MADQVFKIAVEISAKGVAGAASKIDGATGKIGRGASRASGSVDRLARSVRTLQQVATVVGIGQLTKSVIEAGMVFKRADNILKTVTGSTSSAQEEFTYLREEADRLGLAIGDMVPIYGKWAAAASQTALTAEQVRSIFSEVAEAGVVLGFSSDQTRGALNALTQMASKGCHARGTAIRMADGSSKLVEEILAGDSLRGPDGFPRKVLSLARGKEPMYRITPESGEPFVVNRGHILRAYDLAQQSEETLDLVEILAMPRDRRRGIRLVNRAGKQVAHVAFKVEEAGTDDFFGFAISGDHLYLDAQGFVHHNTIQMEELKGQLGDRMPTALVTMAKALDVTIPRLIKMVEAGEVLADDALPKFAAELDRTISTTEAVAAASEFSVNQIARMRNAFTELGAVAEDRLAPVLADMAMELKNFAQSDDAIELAEALGDTLAAAGKGVIALAENIDTVKSAIGGLIALQIGSYLAGIGLAADGAAAAMARLGGAFNVFGALAIGVLLRINEEIKNWSSGMQSEMDSMVSEGQRLKGVMDRLREAIEVQSQEGAKAVWEEASKKAAEYGDALEAAEKKLRHMQGTTTTVLPGIVGHQERVVETANASAEAIEEQRLEVERLGNQQKVYTDIADKALAAASEFKSVAEQTTGTVNELSEAEKKLLEKFQGMVSKMEAQIKGQKLLNDSLGKGTAAMLAAEAAAEALADAQQLGVDASSQMAQRLRGLHLELLNLEAGYEAAQEAAENFQDAQDTNVDLSGEVEDLQAQLQALRDGGVDALEEVQSRQEALSEAMEEANGVTEAQIATNRLLVEQKHALSRAIDEEREAQEKATKEAEKKARAEKKAAEDAAKEAREAMQRQAENMANDLASVAGDALRQFVEDGEVNFQNLWDGFLDMAIQAIEEMLQKWIQAKLTMEGVDLATGSGSGSGDVDAASAAGAGKGAYSALGTAGLVTLAAFVAFDIWSSEKQSDFRERYGDGTVFSGSRGQVDVGIATAQGLNADQAHAEARAMQQALLQLAASLGVATSELDRFEIKLNRETGRFSAYVGGELIADVNNLQGAFDAVLRHILIGAETLSANMQQALEQTLRESAGAERLTELIKLAQQLDSAHLPDSVERMRAIFAEWSPLLQQAIDAHMDYRDAVALLGERLQEVRDDLQGQLDQFLDPSGALEQVRAFQELESEILGYNQELDRQLQAVRDLTAAEEEMRRIRERTEGTNPLSQGEGGSPTSGDQGGANIENEVVGNAGDMNSGLAELGNTFANANSEMDRFADTFGDAFLGFADGTDAMAGSLSGISDGAGDAAGALSGAGGGGGLAGALGDAQDAADGLAEATDIVVGIIDDTAHSMEQLTESMPDPIEIDQLRQAQRLMVAGIEQSLGSFILQYTSNAEIRQRVEQALFDLAMAKAEAEYQALVASQQVADGVLATYRAALDELHGLGPGTVGVATGGGGGLSSSSSGAQQRQERRAEIRAEMSALEDLLANGPKPEALQAWEEIQQRIASLTEEMQSLATFTAEEIALMESLQRRAFIAGMVDQAEALLAAAGRTDVQRQIAALDARYDAEVAAAEAAGATAEEIATLNAAREAEREAIREAILAGPEALLEAAGRGDMENQVAAINDHYDALIEDAQAADASAEEIETLNAAREEEINQLREEHRARVEALGQTSLNTGTFTARLADLREEIAALVEEAMALGESLGSVQAAGHAATQQLGADFLSSLNSISGFEMPPEIARRLLEMQRAMVLMDLAALAAAGAFDFLNGELPEVPRTVAELLASAAPAAAEEAANLGAVLVESFLRGAALAMGPLLGGGGAGGHRPNPIPGFGMPNLGDKPGKDPVEATEEGNGLLQDLLDAINSAFDDLIAGVGSVESAIHSTSGGSNQFDSDQDRLEAFIAQWITPNKGRFTSQAIALNKAIEDLLEDMHAILLPQAEAAAQEAQALMRKGILDAFRGDDLQTQFDSLIASFEDAQNAMGLLGATAEELAELQELQGEALQDFLDGVNQGFQDILDSFAPGGEFSQASGREEVESLFAEFQSLAAQLQADPLNQDLRGQMEQIARQLLGATEGFDGSGPLMQTVIAQVQEILSGLLLDAGDFDPSAGSGDLGNLLDLLDQGSQSDNQLLSSIDGTLVEIRDGILGVQSAELSIAELLDRGNKDREEVRDFAAAQAALERRKLRMAERREARGVRA